MPDGLVVSLVRQIKINLKGVLLGNPLLLLSLDGPGQVETWWRMNVISNETYTGLMKYCYKTPDDNQVLSFFVCNTFHRPLFFH